MKLTASLTAWLTLFFGLATTVAQDAASVEFFETHIRPVLVEKCYQCHSTSEETNGGLALDSKPGWQRGGDSGAAIEPGQPAKSRLIEALEYTNSNLQMPPEGKLPVEVIERFKAWVAAGAVDPREQAGTSKATSTALPLDRAGEHWAYRPIAHSIVPTTEDADAMSATTPIDSFLARKQREVSIEAAPIADDGALMRRVTYDLHGLPPTAEELQRFIQDSDPTKYERLVERLLASPRFGERMARRWMDVARYAESVTLRGFVLPQAWRYRDYLIAAFNEDRSLAEMIQEQIAGDLLEHPDWQRRSQQVVATTFLALGNTNLEEQDKNAVGNGHIDEQLEVIGKAFLGQTLGCARCHDHKFDPIPTRDYYALAGIFRSTRAMEHDNVSKWIERPLPLPAEELAHFEALTTELNQIQKLQADLEKQVKATAQPGKAAPVALSTLSGIVIDDTAAKKVGRWMESTSEKPYVSEGYLHDAHEKGVAKTITFEPKSLPPGTYAVRMSYTASSNRCTKTVVRVFSADGEQQLAINQRQTPPIDGLWISLGEHRFEKDGQAFVLVSNEEADGHVIADAVQFLPRAGGTEVASTSGPASSAAIKSDAATGASLQAELKQVKDRRAALESQLATRPMALSITEELPVRDVPVHIRGSVHNLGSVVPRGFLQLARFEPAAALPAESSGRKELAQWLTDARHPLTPRVISNRLWVWAFGSGIVRTVDNFGTTGEAPLDIELLDYLATKLLEHDWSTKTFMRQLVLSDAYRRTTLPGERAAEIDPDNRYFSHAPAKLIDVESLRDAMLAISGELTIPGTGSTLRPEVKEDYRYAHQPTLRAVYLPILRNSLPELFEAFDFPNSSVSTGIRSQSTVAPQALALLNSPWVLERAQHAGQRLINDAQVSGNYSTDDWQKFIGLMFMRCLGREPTELERYSSITLVDELREQQLSADAIATRLVHGIFASIDFRYLE